MPIDSRRPSTGSGALYCAANAAAQGTSGVRRPDASRWWPSAASGGAWFALHSDVDVLVLCDRPDDPHVSTLAEGFLYPLWDLGLSIGHAVRGVKETLALARTDVRTATTLLDLRCVAGDRSIVQELHDACRQHVFEPALGNFISALRKDFDDRHERFGGSLYLLEPEVKMGRGGTRDIDVAVWAAKARWDCHSTQDFVKSGALLAREGGGTRRRARVRWRVRNLLHLPRWASPGPPHIRRPGGDCAVPRLRKDGATLGVERSVSADVLPPLPQIVAQTAEADAGSAAPYISTRRMSATDLGGELHHLRSARHAQGLKELETDPALALRFHHQRRQVGPATLRVRA
ncbi:MAG: hypothetical protein R3A78_09995 [Polyangiales bacterium]